MSRRKLVDSPIPVKRSALRWTVLVMLSLAAVACSSSDEVPPAQNADGAPPEGAEAAEGFPNLAEVPPRPDALSAADRSQVVEGLAADRANARYSDSPLAQSTAAGATPPPPAPPGAAQRRPAPSAVPSFAQPSPAEAPAVAAAPATPVQRAPVAAAPESSRTMAPPPAPVSPPPAAPVSTAPSRTTNMPASDAVTVNLAALPAAGAPMPVGGPVPATVIYFGHGSSALSGNDLARIRQVAVTQGQRGGAVTVVGHASMRTGDMPANRRDQANLEISWKRANAVADALVQAGVPAAAVSVTALSDSRPIYYEVMPAGEAGNRRVEVYLQ